MGFLSFIVNHNIIGALIMAVGVVLLFRRRSLIDTSEDTENKYKGLFVIALAVMALGVVVLCSPLYFEIAGIKI